MNEKYKEYLKNLSPELQEKARDINTQEELMEFLSDNDVELPEDALDAVSGGCGGGSESSNENPSATVFKGECPDCGGDLIYDDIIDYVDGIRRNYGGLAHCAKTGVKYYQHLRNRKEYDWRLYQK